MELGEVPAEPTVRAWVRKPHLSDVPGRTGEELFRYLPEPAQQVLDEPVEQRGEVQRVRAARW